MQELNGLCVYKGPKGGRYYMRNGKGRYLSPNEEIILAQRLVIYFNFFLLKESV